MRCREPRELVGAFFDGELVGEEHEAMAAHLRECETCAAALAELRAMSGRLSTLPRETAPLALSGRIRAEIGAADSARASSAFRPPRGWLVARGMRTAAAIAAACLLTAASTWGILSRVGTADRLERDALSAHLRAMVQERPVQIASSASHVVKPWFAGRVDFAPAVIDLTAQGFPLIGARIDYVADRRVGTLVYKRREHIISIFMWAASGEAPSGPASVSDFNRHGHNMLTWTKAGVVYWAVTDLNRAELEQLQRML